LKQPETAVPNAIVTTASGSQYKLMGDPVGGTNPFALSSSSSSSSLLTISTTPINVPLVVVSGIFVFLVLQKAGLIGSFPMLDDKNSNIANLSWRAVALFIYCIGIVIATIQLIDDANKLSKN
jgi:ABC-type tungstate transport system substrate-binding protein